MDIKTLDRSSIVFAIIGICFFPISAIAGRKIDLTIKVQESKVLLQGKLETGDELRIVLSNRSHQTVLFASEMAREPKPVTATLELHSPAAEKPGTKPIPELRFESDGRTQSLPVRQHDVIPSGNWRFTNSFAMNERFGVGTIKDEKGQCEAVLWATITRRHPGDKALVEPKLPKTPPGVWLELKDERHSDEMHRLSVLVHNDSTAVFSFENGAEDGPGSLDDRVRNPIGTTPTVLPEVISNTSDARIVMRPMAFRTKGESPSGRTGAHVVEIPAGGQYLYASWKVASDLVTDDVLAVRLTLLDGREIKTSGYEAMHGGPAGAK